MGLQERPGCEPDEIHGKRRIRVQPDEPSEESRVIRFGSIQYAKPLLPVSIPERQPLMELLGRYIETFIELFEGMKPCKVLSEKTQDEEQAVAGVRDDDVREDSVSVPAAITEYPENT